MYTFNINVKRLNILYSFLHSTIISTYYGALALCLVLVEKWDILRQKNEYFFSLWMKRKFQFNHMIWFSKCLRKPWRTFIWYLTVYKVITFSNMITKTNLWGIFNPTWQLRKVKIKSKSFVPIYIRLNSLYKAKSGFKCKGTNNLFSSHFINYLFLCWLEFKCPISSFV